eukprot:45488-Rhodomonas_salina.1
MARQPRADKCCRMHLEAAASSSSPSMPVGYLAVDLETVDLVAITTLLELVSRGFRMGPVSVLEIVWRVVRMGPIVAMEIAYRVVGIVGGAIRGL